MPRTARIVHPGVPHHLIHRGNNRRRLFSHWNDYLAFQRHVGAALARTTCELHQITLMSNHVHLVVTPPDARDLARFVHGFGQRYARYRNDGRAGSGKLFEERYASVPILDDDQLAVTMAYCDLNPVRAGMCAWPEQYPWSASGLWSGRAAACRIDPRLLTPHPWYLALAATAPERRDRYADLLAACRAGDRGPAWRPQIDEYESASLDRYSVRLQRPDHSSAREFSPPYGLQGTWAVAPESVVDSYG